MPLSLELTRLAENEVRFWSIETGSRLELTGRMADQIRELTAETLYRRLQEKYTDRMAGYTLDDLKESVFADGDYFNDNWFANQISSAGTTVDDGRFRDEELRRLQQNLPIEDNPAIDTNVDYDEAGPDELDQ